MIRKVKIRDTEVLKLNLVTGSFQNDNTFKASIGQRGLNLRDILTRLDELTRDLEDGVELNVRFMIDRKDSSNIRIDLIGPTSTCQIRSVLEQPVQGRLVTNEEIDSVYRKYEDHWNGLTMGRDPIKARSMIRGKLMSMGAFLETNE